MIRTTVLICAAMLIVSCGEKSPNAAESAATPATGSEAPSNLTAADTPAQAEAEDPALRSTPATTNTAAAITESTARAVEPPRAFTCGDGTKLSFRYADRAAFLKLPEGEARLAGQASSSGFAYKNADYELRGSGNSAKFTMEGAPLLTCTGIAAR